MRNLLVSIIVLVYCFSFAAAQTPQNHIDPSADLNDCLSIADDVYRLKCFDLSVANMRKRKEFILIDAQSAKDIEQEAFGFYIPSLSKLGLPHHDADSKNPDVHKLPVTSVQKRGGNYIFYMHNGQIWRQISGRVNYIPKGDLDASIKSDAIGGYRMSVSNGRDRVRGIGVRRVE